MKTTRWQRGWVVAAVLAAASPAWADAVYDYVGSPYTTTSGPTYTTAMQVTGRFTTAVPLPGGMAWTNVTGQVQSFSFSDGAPSPLVIDQGNATSRTFWASTGPGGEITSFRVDVYVGGGNRINVTDFGDPGARVERVAQGSASTPFSGAFTRTVTAGPGMASVPTLGEWGLVLLSLLVATLGLHASGVIGLQRFQSKR